MAVRRVKVNLQIVRERDDKVYVRLRWKGQTEPHTLGWVSLKDAEAERDRVAAQLLLGLSPTDSPAELPVGPTVLDLLGEYGDDVERRRVGGDGYRANIENRSVALGAHLGRILAVKLTQRDLEDYVATRRQEMSGRRKSRLPHRATVQDELRLLRRVFDKTRKWGKHDREFPDMPSFAGWPDDARPPRRLSADEVAAMIATAQTDRPALARLIGFMAWCPRRPIAIFALTRRDCRRATDPAYVGNDLLWIARDKGQRDRGWSPLLPPARACLVEHLRDSIGPPDAPVWTTPTGLPYNAARLGRQLAYLTVKAKIDPVTPYDLRKHGAVQAYRAADRSLRAACRFTGHADPATLLRHYLFDEEEAVTRAVRGGDE